MSQWRHAELKKPNDQVSITLTVNGKMFSLQVKASRTLASLLRDQLGLTGTKVSCEQGECGACTVLLDNKAVNSCLVLAAELDGAKVRTIEGLARPGRLDPVQEAFLREGAVQCGYCTPGMIMSAKALLDETPDPGELEIRRALAGNFCRCTGYSSIIRAIKSVAVLGGSNEN